MINKFSKRKNLSKKDAESYLKSQSIQDDIAKFDSSFKELLMILVKKIYLEEKVHLLKVD
jgi:hypothetical protein